MLTYIKTRVKSAKVSFWIGFVTGFGAACQATVTLWMITWKDDIRKVIVDNLPIILRRCCCRNHTWENESGRVTTSGLSSDSCDITQELSPPLDAEPATPEQPPASVSSKCKQSEWEEEDVYESADTPSLEEDEDPEQRVGDVEQAPQEGTINTTK